jgi:hypothetical protein
MSTWQQLLADIREDLKDTAAQKRWSDAALFVWAKDAVRDYSLYFPLYQARVELAASEGSYPLPPDYLGGEVVECPAYRFLERISGRPGNSYIYLSTGLPTAYFIIGGRLYLHGVPQPGDTLLISYDAVHPVPATADDSAFQMTVPMLDEELLRLYVKAKATEQYRTSQAALDRFKLGSGDRQDNPMAPEVGDLMQEYHRKIAERFAGGVIQLYRPGRPR